MKRTLISILVLLFMAGIAQANPASQTLVTTGRAALFNNGSPTCSGIIAANGHFEAAVQADPADQAANLFYALTRLAVMGLEKGAGQEFETVLDILESFGIFRTADDDILNSPIYSEPPKNGGSYAPPATTPETGLISLFVNDKFAILLDDVLANLSKVDQTIAVTLTAQETGDTAVEIDYGDVLMFRGMVNTMKGFLLTLFAYNLDGIDARELTQLGQADMFRIQRDLLDNYPSALSLISGGAVQLSSARAALITAVDQYQAAHDFILTEADNQDNDLFSFNLEDMNEVKGALAHLQEGKASLIQDRDAGFVSNNQGWYFYDEYGRALRIELDFGMGFFKEASFYSTWYSGPNWGPAFDFFPGEVTGFNLTGDILTLTIEGWSISCGHQIVTFTGTLNPAKNSISGTWAPDPCNAFAARTFTGSKFYDYDSIELVNLNAVFGSPSKNPMDMRAASPRFDLNNNPVAGTFPGAPVLNGLVPYQPANDDLTRALKIQPDGAVNPVSTPIVLDGAESDWTPSTLVFTDTTDVSSEPIYHDIRETFMAKSGTDLFMAMKFESGSPFVPATDQGGMFYQIHLRTTPDRNLHGQLFIEAGYDTAAHGWRVRTYKFGSSGFELIQSYGIGSAAVGSKFIEFKIPLADIESEVGLLNGKFLTFKSCNYDNRFNHEYKSGDFNPTLIRIQSPFRISGQVSSNSAPAGTILMKAMYLDSWDQMNSSYLYGPGAYEIPLLAASKGPVALMAFQDFDFNGIRTPDEPFAFHTLSGLSSDSVLNLNLTFPDSDVDGHPDYLDAFPGNPNEWEDTDKDGTGDNADTDDDNDDLPDSFEILFGLDPKSAAGDDGNFGDVDGDGLSNYYEFSHNSNPSDENSVPDSDNDGDQDGKDLLFLISGLGMPCSGECPADMNRDGGVNSGDIAFFAKRFGYVETGSFARAGRLPDTGQTTSYTNTPGEDSDYTLNSPSYTKQGHGGIELPDTAIPADGWIMTRDNVTGLIWEVKQSKDGVQNYADPNDADNVYTWADAGSIFIARLNAQGFGGRSDWRLPTILELSLLVHPDKVYPQPIIDTSYFPNVINFYTWSGTPLALDSDQAWRVNFGSGSLWYDNKAGAYSVRAVCGPSYQGPILRDNGDGTLTDARTGLMWIKATHGPVNWDTALNHCETLTFAGYSDWRLPNRHELQSLADYRFIHPASDPALIPGLESSGHWSSSTYAIATGHAWNVNMEHGGVYYPQKSENHYIRAVRGTPR